MVGSQYFYDLFVTGRLLQKLRSCVQPESDHIVSSETETQQPPAMKARFSLFGHYIASNTQSKSSADKTPGQVLTACLNAIGTAQLQLNQAFQLEQYQAVRGLMECVLCVPASSAPLERVFAKRTYYEAKPCSHVK